MVLAHLHTYPRLDFSPAELANVLDRPKSRGAIINACKRLVELGLAERTQTRPQRYRAAPSNPSSRELNPARPLGSDRTHAATPH